MKIPLKSWFLIAALAVAPALGGCVAVVAGAAGAGTVAWVRGELDANLNASFDQSLRAVDQAIKQLEFAKVSEKHDALSGAFVARTAEDKKIEIHLDKVNETNTKVAIRVGLFGDQALSMTILGRIKGNL